MSARGRLRVRPSRAMLGAAVRLVALASLVVTTLACGPAASSRPAAIPPTSPPSPSPSPASDAAADEVAAPARDAARTPELDAITLPRRPAWTDKYFEAGPDQHRFEITAVMERHGLTRTQAVEAQNFYRDLARTRAEADLDSLLRQAVARARAGEFEDRRDVQRLAAARFIVVFDLDDTLYDQHYPAEIGNECHDLEVPTPDGPRWVKLVPGWERAFRRIVELGGAVVLFSANTDDKTWANGRAWAIGDTPIVESPLVSGFLTNSHLVQQHKREGDPVQEPSKDLRVLDESLRRAIIVDDNPGRIVQHANLRLFKKFHAAELCRSPDKAIRRAYHEALPQVVHEIEDSVRWLDAHPGADFVTAYRPFTSLGRVATDFVRHTMGLSEKKAIDWLRRHPEFIDTDF